MNDREKMFNDVPPIEDTQEWIDMSNDVKREYSADGINIIDYETNNPKVVMFKWGYSRRIIWDVAPAYKSLFRVPNKFLSTIRIIRAKIKKDDSSLKYAFEKGFNIYESNGNKILCIINEEIKLLEI